VNHLIGYDAREAYRQAASEAARLDMMTSASAEKRWHEDSGAAGAAPESEASDEPF
jgi:hypothetical protein